MVKGKKEDFPILLSLATEKGVNLQLWNNIENDFTKVLVCFIWNHTIKPSMLILFCLLFPIPTGQFDWDFCCFPSNSLYRFLRWGWNFYFSEIIIWPGFLKVHGRGVGGVLWNQGVEGAEAMPAVWYKGSTVESTRKLCCFVFWICWLVGHQSN